MPITLSGSGNTISASGSVTISTSPIPVATPFVEYGAFNGTSNPDHLSAANDIAIFPFYLPYAMTVTNIIINVTAADGSNNSDVGIYDTAGNLLGQAGAQLFSSTGILTCALSGGAIDLPAGLYLFGITSASTTMSWACGPADNGNTSIYYFSTSTASSGGTLPNITIAAFASITPQAACFGTRSIRFLLT